MDLIENLDVKTKGLIEKVTPDIEAFIQAAVVVAQKSGHDALDRACASIMKTLTLRCRPRVGSTWNRRTLRELNKILYNENHSYSFRCNGWSDHPRIEKVHGVNTQTFHPYDIKGADAFKQLLELEQNGFDVTIHGNSSHFPGWTVCIELKKKQQ